MNNEPLLAVRDLKVRYDQAPAVVDGASFTLSRGETIALVGESGSGKSTVCYGLIGLLPPEAKVSGSAVLAQKIELVGASEQRMRQVRGRRIAMVFQDPVMALNPYLQIGSQIVEALRIHAGVSRTEARDRALALLDEVGIEDATRRFNHYPHEFSGGMCQRVMLAIALIAEPDLLLADEPTSALDVQVQAQILALIQRIQQNRALSLILVSHDLKIVKDVADSVIVMERGVIVEQQTGTGIWRSPSHPFTRRLLAAIPSGPKQVGPASMEVKPLLTVDDVHVWFGKTAREKGFHALKGVGLTVGQGEVLGMVGESGSGKTTLARVIMCLQGVDRGKLTLDGHNLRRMSGASLRSLRKHWQMVFQDPYGSLSPRMRVQEILMEPLLLHKICASPKTARQRVEALLEEVGLPPSIAGRYPHQFSGGQRQRIAIARALACEPALLVADEMVSALDVTVQSTIIELLLKLARERRLAVLFISHDLAVVRLVADRVAVMKNGEIVETNSTEKIIEAPAHPYTRELVALAMPQSGWSI